MTTRNQNVKIYRGNSASLEVSILNADGTQYDPTAGAFMRWKLAKSSAPLGDEWLVQKELNDGIAGEPGKVTITIEGKDTDLPPGVYYHELKVWDNPDVATAMIGAFIVKPSARMGDVIESSAGTITLSATMPAVV